MNPIVWTIAGSDSGGGAGVQADLKAIQACGAHGATIITALTAQNTTRVENVESVNPEMFRAQWRALESDLPPRAVKIGMIGSVPIANEIVARLPALDCPVVVDPVLVASSGDALSNKQTVEAIRDRVIPLAFLVTPNIPEAEALTGIPIRSEADIVRAANALMSLGARAVLIKGGHLSGEVAEDHLFEKDSYTRFASVRSEREAHGTGCTLSSAIAAHLAQGQSLKNAVALGKELVTRSLRSAKKMGKGFPLLDTTAKPVAADFPEANARPLRFPVIKESLGFYLIVDSLAWLERAISFGVKTIQLRNKNAEESEIARAIQIGKDAGVRLFINDNWEWAIRHEAYGVHLGQSDLLSADLTAIAQAGLKLGVSTHEPYEIAVAKGIHPSYCAIGTIYPTTLKKMPYPVVGVSRLENWRRFLDIPVVAIGGITLERAPSVLTTGVDSIAVVSDVTAHANPFDRTRNWLELFEKHRVPKDVSNFEF